MALQRLLVPLVWRVGACQVPFRIPSSWGTRLKNPLSRRLRSAIIRPMGSFGLALPTSAAKWRVTACLGPEASGAQGPETGLRTGRVESRNHAVDSVWGVWRPKTAAMACDMVPMMDVASMKATVEVKKRSGLGVQNFQRVRGSSML